MEERELVSNESIGADTSTVLKDPMVLRYAGIVIPRKQGTAVYCSPAMTKGSKIAQV